VHDLDKLDYLGSLYDGDCADYMGSGDGMDDMDGVDSVEVLIMLLMWIMWRVLKMLLI
jgi:hypothetical protein